MFFDDLINNEYRAFCSGELSFTLERFGGINSISLLDVREFDGKMYPDRFPVPWLQRRAGEQWDIRSILLQFSFTMRENSISRRKPSFILSV